MAITRTGKRTGADKKTCPIHMCYRPDMAEPDEYTCVAAITGNVRDCSEYGDPAVVEQEQRDYEREYYSGYAAGWLLPWQYPQWFVDEEIAALYPVCISFVFVNLSSAGAVAEEAIDPR